MYPIERNGMYGSGEYPGYWVTLDGRIWSDRTSKFLSPIKMGEYLGVQIKDRSNRLVKRYMHRLILEIMTGHIPEGMHACHNNGNRKDNRYKNLRWASPMENNADKRAHGTVSCGERNPMSKLTWEIVEEIRILHSLGAVQRNLCKQYGVSPMTISRVVRNQLWSQK
jgi:hypothetical protein